RRRTSARRRVAHGTDRSHRRGRAPSLRGGCRARRGHARRRGSHCRETLVAWIGGRAVALPPMCNRSYGVSLLIRVDQFASAVRPPGPWVAPPHVPSRLSPEPSAKNGPPQSV